MAVNPSTVRSRDHLSFTRSDEPFIRFYDQRFKHSFYLSNFFPHQIPYEKEDGTKLEFKCAEAFYHALRAAEADPRDFEPLSGPEAWRYAQKLKKEMPFSEHKLEIMHQVVFEKFSSIELKEKLLSTQDAFLVERTKDEFWGDGILGEGQNHLGSILMKVREELGGDYGVVEKPEQYLMFLTRKAKTA